MRRTTLFALLTTISILAMALLPACGGESTPAETEPPPPTATSAPEEPTSPPPEPTQGDEPAPTEPEEEPTPEPTEEPPASDDQGLVLLEERCTECHTLDRVTRASKSREQWEQTVDRMIGRGAELNDDERAVLIDYLTETYGP